jgi:hypothetical protein
MVTSSHVQGTTKMKCARWELCSEASIASQVFDLQEVEANLSDLQLNPVDPDVAGKIVVAISFIRQAIYALAETKSESTS